MNLTSRQMLILLALIVGFSVAAVLVSQDEAGGPGIDRAVWCDGAEQLSSLGPLLRGETAEATVEQLDAAKEALFAVENTAPVSLQLGITRLADFTIVAKQARGTTAWPDAYVAARGDVEADVIDQALADLAAEMSSCGHSLG